MNMQRHFQDHMSGNKIKWLAAYVFCKLWLGKRVIERSLGPTGRPCTYGIRGRLCILSRKPWELHILLLPNPIHQTELLAVVKSIFLHLPPSRHFRPEHSWTSEKISNCESSWELKATTSSRHWDQGEWIRSFNNHKVWQLDCCIAGMGAIFWVHLKGSCDFSTRLLQEYRVERTEHNLEQLEGKVEFK